MHPPCCHITAVPPALEQVEQVLFRDSAAITKVAVSLVARLTSMPDDSAPPESFRAGSGSDCWQLVSMRPGLALRGTLCQRPASTGNAGGAWQRWRVGKGRHRQGFTGAPEVYLGRRVP
jgi:hypothetical protein